MPSLMDACLNVLTVLKPQKQGTCGLYSFWFATLMLNSIRPGKKQVVYPRGCEALIKSTYQVNVGGRQALNNLLFAVY